MGILLSAVIAYAGVKEAVECLNHIIAGVTPNTQPDFQDLVDYYNRRLRKLATPSSSANWINECGQCYLCLAEDSKGNLKSATVNYYGSDSTAILFSTKISSFGQESIEESQPNGDYKYERSSPKTKTIVSNSESYLTRFRDRSPVNVISNHYPKEEDETATWAYNPQNSTPPTPEIHFQSYDDDKVVYNEDFLRSLDGIKYRPLQRNDPNGRRRSFRKRHSSSSNSSRESRASREEELKMFTSLEQAEFERMNKDGITGNFGSAPNLLVRSNSRSQSRERRRENGSVEDINTDVNNDNAIKKDVPKLDSYEEDTKETTEVIEEEEEIDFWGNMGD